MWDGNTWFSKSEGIYYLLKFHCQKQWSCMTLPVSSFTYMAILLLFKAQKHFFFWHKSYRINELNTFIGR